jgi:hypothetical protein
VTRFLYYLRRIYVVRVTTIGDYYSEVTPE